MDMNFDDNFLLWYWKRHADYSISPSYIDDYIKGGISRKEYTIYDDNWVTVSEEISYWLNKYKSEKELKSLITAWWLDEQDRFERVQKGFQQMDNQL